MGIKKWPVPVLAEHGNGQCDNRLERQLSACLLASRDPGLYWMPGLACPEIDHSFIRTCESCPDVIWLFSETCDLNVLRQVRYNSPMTCRG